MNITTSTISAHKVEGTITAEELLAALERSHVHVPKGARVSFFVVGAAPNLTEAHIDEDMPLQFRIEWSDAPEKGGPVAVPLHLAEVKPSPEQLAYARRFLAYKAPEELSPSAKALLEAYWASDEGKAELERGRARAKARPFRDPASHEEF